jgi:hypothetical protein
MLKLRCSTYGFFSGAILISGSPRELQLPEMEQRVSGQWASAMFCSFIIPVFMKRSHARDNASSKSLSSSADNHNARGGVIRANHA